MKELNCNECGAALGEMTKGRIKKDAVLLCGKCNYERLLCKNAKYEMHDIPKDENFMGFFNSVINSKK